MARAKAVLASGDRVDAYLLGRNLAARLEADRRRSPGQGLDRQALAEVLAELQGRLADPKAAEKREKAERRISAAQVLDGRVGLRHRHLDGSMDAAMRGHFRF